MLKRFLSTLLVLVLCLSLLPAVPASAASPNVIFQYTAADSETANVRFKTILGTWNVDNTEKVSVSGSYGSAKSNVIGAFVASVEEGYILTGWKVTIGSTVTEYSRTTDGNIFRSDYSFGCWYGNPTELAGWIGSQPTSSGGVLFGDTPSGNVIVEPIFETAGSQYKVTILDSPSDIGTVIATDELNNNWQLTATPNPGYGVDKWQYTTDTDVTYENQDTKSWTDVPDSQKLTITETIAEDRTYRAVFGPAKVVFLGDTITLFDDNEDTKHVIIAYLYNIDYSVFTIANPPPSYNIKEGMTAYVYLRFTAHSEVTDNLSFELYSGAEAAGQPFASYNLGSKRMTPSALGIYARINDMPYLTQITVKATLGDAVSQKTFNLNGAVHEDVVKPERAAALAALENYYTDGKFGENPPGAENLPDETYKAFADVRYLLTDTYEKAYQALKFDAESVDAINTARANAMARFESLIALQAAINNGDGEFYKTVPGVVKVAVARAGIPIAFAYVPVFGPSTDSYYAQIRDGQAVALIALESYLEAIAPGTWYIGGSSTQFGLYITSIGISNGDGATRPGSSSGNIIYAVNGNFPSFGFGAWGMSDRDVMRIGGATNGYSFPKILSVKDDLIWAIAALREKYPEDVLTQNADFNTAVLDLDGWTDQNSGNKQFVVDTLAALKAAFPEANLERYDLPDDVLDVMALIRAIGDVTPGSGTAIEAARSAYDALTALTYHGTSYSKAQVQALVDNYDMLVAAEAALALFNTPTGQAAAILNEALTQLQTTYNANPATGSIGGEWSVLAIARGGQPLTDTETKYLGRLNALLTEKGLDGIGESKYTEYARITLALTSLGIDAQTYSYAGTGYDLISKLTEYDNVTKQGINGAIFALLALDSKPYAPGNTIIRDQYVNYILAGRHDDGGWALSDTKTDPSDPDVTAMALQALANYRNESGVPAAIEGGLAALKGMQDTTYGGFYSYNQYNSESAAQVIVALTALGIDPADENEGWTVGDGKNPVTALLTFYDESSNMFRHVLSGGADPMATEQAVYALVALNRLNTSANTLYDMSDIFGAPSEEGAQKAGLRDAIAAASALRPGDYTAASWDALQTALTSAQAVNGDADATQEQVGNARAALLAAIGDLEPAEVTVHKSVLEAAIAIGDGLTEADYTPASWSAMQTMLMAAASVAADTDAEQDAVDEASDNLLTALADLERAPNMELLNAAITNVQNASLTEADYTAATWTAYSGALTVAQAVYADAAQDEINLAAQSLIAGIGGLEAESTGGDQDCTAVTALLGEIKDSLGEDNYTPATWSALEEAADKAALASALWGLQLKHELKDTALRIIIAEAEKLEQSDYEADSYEALFETLSVNLKLAQGIYTGQDAIDTDAAAILTAMRGLQLSNLPGQVNKALLKSLIDQVSVLQQARYTPATWSALSAALADANTVYDQADAEQDNVNAAEDALLAALGQLETVPGVADIDKTELDGKIAEALQITGTGYTTASWTSFQNALNYAREISADDDATQTEVNNATRGLRVAITGLVPAANKTGLNNKIAEAEALNQGNYTAGSWSALQAALNSAKTVAENNNATQAAVDSAASALATAISKLRTPDPAVQTKYVYISVIDPNAAGNQTSVYYALTELEMNAGETAFSLLERTGLDIRTSTYSQYAGVYVEAINGFGEFDEGPNSGWMYKVNGVFPNYSASLYKLTDKDKVEWVYTRDLGKDVSGDWDPGTEPDPDPGTDPGTEPDPDPGTDPGTEQPPDVTVVTPKVTASNGAAALSMDQAEMNAAIAEAKGNNRSSIVITPEITGEANKVSVELPKNSISSLVTEAEAALTVETPVGTLTLPQEALTAIASQAADSTVTMSLAAVDKTSLTPTQQETAGSKPVYNITVLSGSTHITNFNGAQITISLPYTLQEGESAENVRVWYLNDAGELEQITCTYDEKTGLATFKTDHLSYYLVGVATTKAALHDAITLAKTKNQAQYESGWSDFTAALEAALAVADNPNATQQEIDNALANLNAKTAALVLKDGYAAALYGALDHLRTNVPNPELGSVGGEWAILALARAGIADTAYYDGYYSRILANIADKPAKLNPHKSTENSRLILALTSLGINAADTGGKDLVAPLLSDLSWVTNQGINGAIFALIAIDSQPYAPETPMRQELVDHIIAHQTDDGWAINEMQPDVDTTAMALQALAGYSSQAAVSAAVEKALTWLSNQNISDAESCSQVIVALSASGKDAANYEGKDYIKKLLSYYDRSSNAFLRDGTVNLMATEQSAYALVAYDRFQNRAKSLYDMSDAKRLVSDDTKPEAADKAALTAKIAETEKYSESDYTAGSWSALQVALNNAKAVRDDANATQSAVDNAESTLSAAITNLKKPDPATQAEYAWISVTDPNAAGNQTNVYYALTELEMNAGETAFSLLQRTGLDIRTATYSQYAGVYVEAINSFGEFDDGPNSGWMYKVNGIFPNYSASLYTLNNSDKVEWVYTRDLGKDVGGGWDSGSGGTTSSTTSSTSIKPSAKVSGGAAGLSVTLDDMKDAIGNAKGSSKAIIVAPQTTGTVQAMKVDLSKESLSAIAQQTGSDLNIQTPVGSITIPHSALPSIISQASGSTVTMSLEAVDKSSLTQTQQEIVADSVVYEITILSGGKQISSFDGQSITLSLPYELKTGEKAAEVKVWYLNDAGALEQITCTYDEKTGLATFKTAHLSYYLVGTETGGEEKKKDDFTLNFSDIKSGDWYYAAVKYTVQNGLFVGTTETTFSPNEPLTRAMLVTALHRLAGSPAVTGANNFTDVLEGAWYAKAVIWANTNNIVSGYGESLFGPDDPITREQIAAVLHGYANHKGYDTPATAHLNAYTDAAGISPWAEEALGWANAAGLITGRTATTLVPAGSATRAEAASILMRFAEGFVK